MDNDWFYEYFINEVKAIRKKCISTGSTTQSDWNQNNSKASDYVKNRPFYTGDPVETVFVEESTVSFADNHGTYMGRLESTFVPTVGETYKVSWDGTVYECTCKVFNELSAIGNLSIPGAGSDTGEPFLIAVVGDQEIQIGTADTAASHTISISGIVTPVVKIDPKYIRDMYYTADPVETVFVEETTIPFEDTKDGYYVGVLESTFSATVGETYKVSFDGTTYECTCVNFNRLPVIGNLSIAGPESDTGEPFFMIIRNSHEIIIGTADTSASHTISISGWTTQIVKIDEKYLPDNAVKYTASQNLTDAQKEQARTNIGAGTSSFSPFKPAGNSYLTFSSSNSFTLRVNDATKHWNGILEYYVSDNTWNTWDGRSALSAIDDNGEYALYLRGTGNTVITGDSINYRWILTGADIKCIGNIENLLDYATVESGVHPILADSCYQYMFQGCTSLTQAPVLPATTLAAGCYNNMFSGCTSLTQAPVLPATTLAAGCYNNMFSGCTSLTKAPALPATTLVDDCYSNMFKGCTSLTQAPVLPATTLANYCYSSMFQDCTSLTKAPALPATTLAAGCYNNMFSGCTSLTQAPALPATTLVAYCYHRMFVGCTSLKLSSTKTDEYTQEYRIPSSGEGTAPTNALGSMLASTSGTFTGTPSINTTYYLSSDNMIVRETEIATLNGYVGSMIDNAIDKYVDIAEYIIPSSTEGSTKKFKITVDDTGTISATEVT